MVVSRSGAVVHPCIKEVIFVSGVDPEIRPITRRVAELPSLRYGSVGARTTNTGPLRVTARYFSGGSPEPNRKKRNGNVHSTDDSFRLRRPIRRVRFALPTTDVDSDAEESSSSSSPIIGVGVGSGVVAKPTAGDRRPVRTKTRGAATFISHSHHHHTTTSASSGASYNGLTTSSTANNSSHQQVSRSNSCSNSTSYNTAGISGNRNTNNVVSVGSDVPRRDVSVVRCYPVSSSSTTSSTTTNTTINDARDASCVNTASRRRLRGSGGGGGVGAYSGQAGAFEFNSYNKGVSVPVTASPGVRTRVHPTGRYIRGTLSPTASTATPAALLAQQAGGGDGGGKALLKAARDNNDHLLRDLLRRAVLVGIPENDLNSVDSSGRTVLSYIASNGSIDLLEQILQLPSLDPNKPDNEGNTPLHFAAQAGQVECVNCLLSRCRGIEIDARNNLGFTPLMKAALQGRNKCAKLLLFAGANPTLRDNGRGFRADQWARFCGRYVCADVIEKYARQRLLERSTSYGNWGASENDHHIGARVLMGKVMPIPTIPQQTSNGLKSKLKKVFRTSSGLGRNTTTTTNSNNNTHHNHDMMSFSSARLVTQLTSAALCASSPVLPSAPSVPPVVKSLIRPLTVPKLQITLACNNNSDHPNNNLTTTTNNNNGVVTNNKGVAPVPQSSPSSGIGKSSAGADLEDRKVPTSVSSVMSRSFRTKKTK